MGPLDMTVAELLAAMPTAPVRRAEFHWYSISGTTENGNDWMLDYNYHCEGPYGPDQVVEVPYANLTVWSKGKMNTMHREVRTVEDYENGMRSALAELSGTCDHARSREMNSDEARQLGMYVANCFHNYECLDCGGHYSLDTSD